MFDAFVPEGWAYRQARKFPGSLEKRADRSTPVASVAPWLAATSKWELKEARKNPPEGWHELDGSSFSPFTHWRLFFKIGYRFGRAGLRFRLPDWRGTALGEKVAPNTKYVNESPYPMYVRYMMKVK